MTVTREELAARVKSAITEAGLTQQEVAEAIGLDPSGMSRALSGQRSFKSVELALIAEKLGRTVDSLLSADARPAVTLAARAQSQATTSVAVQEAMSRVAVMLDVASLLWDSGYFAQADAVYELPHGESVEQGEILARRVREELGIGSNPLPANLAEASELLERRLGIDVAFEALPWGLDGLSVSTQGFRLAFVSSRVQATRQRYTLAHEVAHLVANDSQDLLVDEDIFGSRSANERRANAFAAEFLMPREALRSAVRRSYLTEKDVAELLECYRVSLDALAFRLHNTGIVNAAGRDRIRKMSSAVIALRAGRADELQARNERRLPGNLLHRCLEAYVRGDISIRPIAQLVEVEPDKLLEELAPREAVPAPVPDGNGESVAVW